MNNSSGKTRAFNRLSQSEIPSEFIFEIEKELNEIDKMNSKDNEFQSKLPVELLRYAQDLEITIQVQKKEIKRLEYLNKYFVISQQKRDDMLKHALEDNRKLKELNIMYERTMKLYMGNSRKTLASKKTPLPPVMLTAKASTVRESTDNKKSSVHKERRLSKTISGVLENKSKESLLSVSVSDAEVIEMANRNENLSFMKNLLLEEDTFALKLENLDSESVNNLYGILKSITSENFNFYKQISKLKRVLKAAAFMNETMILSEAMERIVDETCDVLDCDRCSLFLIDKSKDELWSKVAKGSNVTIRIPINKGVVGYVATTGEPLNISNAYSDPRFNKEVDIKQNYKTNTILCMPIMENSQIIGVLQAINKKNGLFEKDDEGLLTLISHLASGILMNSLHYDEQLLFHTTLKHILKTGIYLNSFVLLEQLLPNAEKKLKDIMNVSAAKILLVKDQKFIHYDENGEISTFDLDCGIAGIVYKEKQQLSVSSSYNHPVFNSMIDLNTSMPMIVMPLIEPFNENVIGIIEVINSKGMFALANNSKKPPITVYDQESLSFFSQQLSQAISKNREDRHQPHSGTNLIL